MANGKGKSEKINQTEQTKTINDNELVEKFSEVETTDNAKSTSESDTNFGGKVTSAYIDRIEETESGDKKAVLYIDDDDSDELPKIVLPISILPNEIYEGDYVLIRIAYDKEKSESK